ncbi:hypothetical protein EBQ34_06020 [Vandammella animalimorsus]|uniref:Uncharacterized protein n=1 Tax=Vandammella animalimorsus TaxID=2029117 RepID=A0A3M6RL10_9BURK|nr:hypothetical protein [Vandammella animalimorsus]RMX15668.1 hypothetical protein EBQ34_06020 [Vandammella animalimorsus]
MKKSSVIALVLAVLGTAAFAQERVYRCGNEYTNASGASKRQGCRLVEGGNVTVIQSSGSRAPAARRSTASSSSGSSQRQSSAPAPVNAPRVDQSTQRNRDADARTILEAELRKSKERLATLEAEYNNGAPVRTALELRNPQGYIERTAEIKANIERTQADIEGIQREIGRLR